MPLYKGEENLGKNLQRLIDEGYSKKEATAIAIKVAHRKGGKKKKGNRKHG